VNKANDKPTLNLEVPDAEDKDKFLANARRVWKEHHPEKQKEPGRHGDGRIITVLKEVLLSLPRKPYPSIRRLTDLTEEKFKNAAYMAKRFPDDSLPAAWDTIYRYAKLILIFLKWAMEDKQNVADVAYVGENVPASHEAVKEIIEIVSAIQPDISRALESLQNIPRIVGKSGIQMTAARTKSLQQALVAFPTSKKSSRR
jgi:hypothetical protein